MTLLSIAKKDAFFVIIFIVINNRTKEWEKSISPD